MGQGAGAGADTDRETSPGMAWATADGAVAGAGGLDGPAPFGDDGGEPEALAPLLPPDAGGVDDSHEWHVHVSAGKKKKTGTPSCASKTFETEETDPHEATDQEVEPV